MSSGPLDSAFSRCRKTPVSSRRFVLTDDEDLAERIDYYTHLGHLKGEVHGVNYKLAGPLAAIGLRRLRGLQRQLQSRPANAAQILGALPEGGTLAELGYGQ